MYIQGLKSNTAVKVGDRYIVELEHGFSTKYEINGASIGNKRQVVVDKIDDVVKINNRPRKLIYYKDYEGNQYSPQFITEIQNIYFDEDFEEREYPDLDSQIEHIKQLDWVKNDLTPVYEEPKEDREKVDVEVVGCLENTGSDFIESAIQFGKSGWDRSGGIYKVDLSSIARNEVVKLQNQYQSVQVDIPNHSNIEYVKVAGNYIFTKEGKQWIKNNGVVKITQSLDEAKTLEEEVRGFVNKRMMLYIEPVKITDLHAHEIYTKLSNLKSNVSDMKLMKSSSGSKAFALKSINEILEWLTDIKK